MFKIYFNIQKIKIHQILLTCCILPIKYNEDYISKMNIMQKLITLKEFKILEFIIIQILKDD